MTWLTVKRTPKMLEKRAQVVALLKDAGVVDSYIGFAEPVGFMHVQTGNVSVLDNFPSAREDMATIINTMFLQAIGTFRSRIWQTFNPIFWIEFLINLPRHTLKYLGVSPDAVVVKLAQLIWWIACAVFGFLYALYKPELEANRKSVVNQGPALSQPLGLLRPFNFLAYCSLLNSQSP